jgi:AraC-like DNA-binding protein
MALTVRNRFFSRRTTLLVAPLLLCIPAVVGFIKKDLVIFPGAKTVRLSAYSDSCASEHSNGKSYVKELFVDSGSIHFTFHRVPGIEYPYAGFTISRPGPSHFINATPYDYLMLAITSYNAKGVQLNLRTFVPGVTKPDSQATFCPNIRDLYLLPGTHIYRIGLESFNTESWWFNEKKLATSTAGAIDFSKIIDIKIESEDISPLDIDERVRINTIRFEKDNSLLFCATAVIVLLYYLGFWLYARMLARMRTPLAIPYEKLNMINYNDEYLRKIVDTIAKEYRDRTLTIGKICDKTGISPSKIAQVIQLSFNLSFKQYVNTIRLAEACRLFKETDRQISEIALNVGYQNLTHFYRMFKQVYHIAPNEYRKKVQE